MYDSPLASVSKHLKLKIFMYTLHLHLFPSQVSIYSLSLVKDVSDLMSPGNWFHILGLNVFRLLASYVMELWCLTEMSFGLTLGCSFGVNIIFR